MGYSDGIIGAPISIRDVQEALGVNSNDVGTLCQSPYINKWSKMKPVAFPFIEPDRSQQVYAYGINQWWWKGNPSATVVAAGLTIGSYTTQDPCAWITCCGVKFLGFTSYRDVIGAFNPVGNSYDGASNNPLYNNFSYVPPTGGSSQPFRLVDFNYYYGRAEYNVIPDNGTIDGTKRIIAQNPESSKVRCRIMSKSVVNKDAISEISFNDLYSLMGNTASFVLITAVTNSQNTDLTYQSVSQTVTKNDDYFKEIQLDLNSSTVWGKTVIAFYCARVSINQVTYYVPVMQSNSKNYCNNTPIYYQPGVRPYQSWYVDNSEPYSAITFALKINYSTSSYTASWISNPFSTLSLTAAAWSSNDRMNRLYIRIAMPKDSSRTYSFGYNSFMVEFEGMFRDRNGRVNLISYQVTSNDTDFVLRNSEPLGSWNWGSSEVVTVTQGTGVQYCYLAIYDLFENRGAVDTIYGGTIWRISLYYLHGQQYFGLPDCVYGGLDESTRLNINVQAR